jgi:hypothetical protein
VVQLAGHNSSQNQSKKGFTFDGAFVQPHVHIIVNAQIALQTAADFA